MKESNTVKLKQLFNINNGEIGYYKVNNFDDPAKRINKSGFNFKTFESSNDIYKIIVKLVNHGL